MKEIRREEAILRRADHRISEKLVIEPLLDPERVQITFGELGEDYFTALCTSAQQREEAKARGESVEEPPKHVTIASWSLGKYSSEIYVTRPIAHSFSTYHWISLCFDGEPMLKDICAGMVGEIVPQVKVCIVAAVQWGDTDEDVHAARTVASLVAEQRTDMLRHLPALAHWAYFDGRPLDEIAQAWEKLHEEVEAEQQAHQQRMRAIGW